MNITIWNDVDSSPDIVPPVGADPPSLESGGWLGEPEVDTRESCTADVSAKGFHPQRLPIELQGIRDSFVV